MAVTTSDFLRALYPQGLPDGAVLELRIEPLEGRVSRGWCRSFDEVMAKAKPYLNNSKSIWFGPGLRLGEVGTDAGVGWLPALWVDCDDKCFDGDKDAALSRLGSFWIDKQPSIVVDSGHGMQGYWLLDGYALGLDLPQAVSAMRWVHDQLSEGLTRPLDPVHNPSRVMRLPNTINAKAEPIPCRIITFNPDLRYVLSDFGRAETAPAALNAAFTVTTTPVWDLLAQARVSGMPGWVVDALDRPDLHDHGDASNLDFAVVRELVNHLELGDVERVWMAAMLGQRPKVQQRSDYRRQTILNANRQGAAQPLVISPQKPETANAAGEVGNGVPWLDETPPSAPAGQETTIADDPTQRIYGYKQDEGLLLLGPRKNTLLANFRPTLLREVEVRHDGGDSAMEYDVTFQIGPQEVAVRITGGDLENDRTLRKRVALVLPANFIVYPNGWAHLWPATLELAQERGYDREINYADMGWTADGVYLLPGMISGIGPDGVVPTHRMDSSIKRLLERMLRYGLNVRPVVSDSNRQAASEAFRTILALNPAVVAPLATMVLAGPLAAYGARLTPPLVHLTGRTGGFKTTLSVLCLSLMGQFDGESVPESWNSTQNALVRRLHEARDVTLLIDDYKKGGKGSEPVMLVQNYADGTTRSRMASDQENRQGLVPRGLLISTGEDSWEEHESTEARTITLYLRRPDDDILPEFLANLSQAQAMAHNLGLVGGTWVQWLAQRKGTLRETYLARRAGQMQSVVAQHRGVHVRQLATLASLFAMSDLIATFLRECLPDAGEAYAEACAEVWPLLVTTSAERAEEAATREPYMELMSDLTQAYLQGQVWFTHRSKVIGDVLGKVSMSRSDSAGFYDDDNLYLTKKATYRWAEARARQAGTVLTFAWASFSQAVRERYGPHWINGKDCRTGYLLKADGVPVRCTVVPRSALEEPETPSILPDFEDVAQQAWDGNENGG